MESIGIKSRPLRDNYGNILNDLALVKAGLKACEEYERVNGQPAPLQPNFRAWLHGMVEACEAGESPSSYKARTVIRDLPLELIASNTEKINKKKRF